MRFLSIMSGQKTATPWYRDGLRFECTRCGRCCRGEPGFVWVNEFEAALIARFLKLDAAEFTRTYVRPAMGGDALVELSNGDCVFWTPQGCRVYPVRPTQCRTFPFWRENIRSARAWADVARRCPGLDRGRLYLPPEIEHLVEQTDL